MRGTRIEMEIKFHGNDQRDKGTGGTDVYRRRDRAVLGMLAFGRDAAQS